MFEYITKDNFQKATLPHVFSFAFYKGFLANQKRAENLKDTSVLPDLCLSHANQLMIMLTNHRKLLDIKQKCTTAKQELANNPSSSSQVRAVFFFFVDNTKTWLEHKVVWALILAILNP